MQTDSQQPPSALLASISESLPYTAMQEELHRQSEGIQAGCDCARALPGEAGSLLAQRPPAGSASDEQPSPSSSGRRVTFSAHTAETKDVPDSPQPSSLGMRELREVMHTMNYTR